MDRIGDRATHNDGDSWMPIVPVHRSFPFDIEFFFFFLHSLRSNGRKGKNRNSLPFSLLEFYLLALKAIDANTPSTTVSLLLH